MTRRNRCTRIVVAAFLIACMSVVVGCGRKPRGANAQQPGPVAVTPPPAPVRVKPAPPVEPAPVVEQEPVEVVEAVEPVVEPEPPVMPEPVAIELQDYLAAADEAADRGDCASAMDLVSRYRAERADNVMLRIREAGLANDCDRPQRAIALLIDLDARTRAMEPVAAVLAEAYLSMNQPAKAAMTWELRYIVDRTAWDAAVNAATLWLEAGVYSTAHWWYEQALALAPDAPEVQMLASIFEPEEQ